MTEKAEQEIELSLLWKGIRRSLPWIILPSVAVGLGTYFWSASQPSVYSASSTLLSTGAQSSTDTILNNAIVKASPLPEGAVIQAMQSTQVIQPLINSLKKQSSIPVAERERLTSKLSQELREQKMRTLSLTSRLEAYSGNGLYTITGKARTPEAAAILANEAANSLLVWDKARALEGIRRAQAGFKAQLAQIDDQLSTQADAVERQTLIARRANVQSSLVQVGILENSVVGVLSPLSSALPPLTADAPKPLRNGVLATLLSLLLLTGLMALRTIFDRTIRSEDDLVGLSVPTLATIPRLRQRDIVFSGIVRAARQAGLYEAIGFLRVNLLTALHGKPHPVIMITSTAPGEGKSSITATLADGFASSGQRVLIIDADLRRGTQENVWKKFNETGQWRQLIGTGGSRTTREALLNPGDVQVLEVEPNVHMLPAGPSIHDSLAVFNQVNVSDALQLWRQNYDIVLIDSAPLLALADGLVVGKHADAVLMIVEYGRTNTQAVRNALRRAERANLNVIGAVLNKSGVREESNYGYSYSTRGEVKA